MLSPQAIKVLPLGSRIALSANGGATGADPKTGDGAGVLIQIPHEFLLKKCQEEKIDLPAPGKYAAGLVFLPPNAVERKF